MRLNIISMLVILLAVTFVATAQKQDTSYFQQRASSLIIPAIFVGYGFVCLAGKNVIRDLDLTTKSELQEDHPLFAAHADDYLQFAPAATVYVLHLSGIRGEHSLVDATGLYLFSEVIMGITTHSVKSLTRRWRPNGSAANSFPSGHTANAFASAEFLNQEYKDQHPWIGYAGYTVAAATGVLRMYNNKHWLSDVVAGAGFGILSTKISYLVYPKLKRIILGKQGTDYNFMPSYEQHRIGFSFNGRF